MNVLPLFERQILLSNQFVLRGFKSISLNFALRFGKYIVE